MGTKNVRKTKSYVTKEKNFKSVNGLQRNFRKCIPKNSQLFANISKLKPKQKKTLRVNSVPLGVSYHPLKYLHLKWEHSVYKGLPIENTIGSCYLESSKLYKPH